ncbi:MAG: hypothetical protein ACXV8Q_10820 [Methylobacter sp.]
MKPPENCELIVHTGTTELDVCVQQVIDKMMQCGIITTDSFGMNNIESIFRFMPFTAGQVNQKQP